MRFRDYLISIPLLLGMLVPVSALGMDMHMPGEWPSWIGRLTVVGIHSQPVKPAETQSGMMPSSLSMSLFRTMKYQMMLRSFKQGGSASGMMAPTMVKPMVKLMSTEGWPTWIGRLR